MLKLRAQGNEKRATAKMVLALECGHDLHLRPRTNAEHLYNRAACKPGRTALCAECETMRRILSVREEEC